MKSSSKTSELRKAHRDLTQARILEAAIDLLRTEDLDELRIADIATRAGMTERTIYRHFATREELLKGLWPFLQRRVQSSGFPESAAELIALAPNLFANFDLEEGPMRGSVFSKAGRELRLAMNERRKAAFLSAVRQARPDLDGDALTRLAAVVQLLDSAFAWAVMKDFWGLQGAEAGRAVSEAIALLLGADKMKADSAKEESHVDSPCIPAVRQS